MSPMEMPTEKALADIVEKILNEERLTQTDALALYASPDLFAIMQMADRVNSRKNENRVFYNINRHINPTNICVLSCKFCAYSRKPGEEGGYAFSIDEMVAKAGEAVEQGATEVHMVGGLHPRWRFDHYRDMIAAIHRAYPALHLKAFTVVELDWMARKERRPVGEILTELVEAGLGSLPGGGAEIFHPEVRDAICDTKVSAEMWLATHKLAHELGLHSNATMLYGHIEKLEHRIDHMERLRQLQDETGGFNAFIPLSFQPFQNEMGIKRYTYGFDDLKTIAIARLFLDNFRHIKAYWIMLGQDIAQLALTGGASDLDGTVVEERISRMAGGRSGMALTRSSLESMIRRAGRIPIERDTLYRAVRMEDMQVGTDATESARPSMPSLIELIKQADGVRDSQPDNTSVSASFVFAPEIVDRTTSEIVEDLRLARQQAADNGQNSLVDAVELRLGQFPASELPTFADLLRLIWAMREGCGGLPVVVSGLKNLWLLAQAELVELSDLLGGLREAGVSSVESCFSETEADLTHSEVVTIHRSIHLCGLPTIAKVELSANKRGEPLWNSFRKRLSVLNELQMETNGLWGVSVEVAPGALVTPVDYMRAVAFSRQSLPTVTHVISSLYAIPTLGHTQGLGAQKTHHQTEKLGPICLLAGASDLGRLAITDFSPENVWNDIRSAGFQCVRREGIDDGGNGHGRSFSPLDSAELPFPAIRNESSRFAQNR